MKCGIFSYLVCLWASMIYYMVNRVYHTKMLSFGTVLFMVCEFGVILIGCINTSVLLNGLIGEEGGGRAEGGGQQPRPGEQPDVLVLIPTYNEPIDIIARTIDAVLAIDYPPEKYRIVVGDDGNRSALETFLERYDETHGGSVVYHRRTRIRGHAKAGNINDMLFRKRTDGTPYYQGSYVLILDCDMAPCPTILRDLMPRFGGDDGCAFVQSPQHFCNIDGFDWLGQSYTFFYYTVMRAYAGFGLGVPCCGTNVVFRRSILESIGGFQYGSVTEDFHTSMKLHSLGFRSRYFCERPTAIGYAPASLVDFFHQRQRWITGGLQIVLTTPSYIKVFFKIPWVYRWIYGFSGLSPFISVPMSLLMIGPLLELAGIRWYTYPFGWSDYLRMFSPYAVLYTLALIFLNARFRVEVFVVSMCESIFMIPYQVHILLEFLLRHIIGIQRIRFRSRGYHHPHFRITPKPAAALASSSSTTPSQPSTSVVTTLNDGYLLETLYLLSPFVMYIAAALVLTIGRSRAFFIYHACTIGWVYFIAIQTVFPIMYVTQTILPECYNYLSGCRKRAVDAAGT